MTKKSEHNKTMVSPERIVNPITETRKVINSDSMQSSQNEFIRLFEYFKSLVIWTFSAITLISAVGIFYIAQDSRGIKAEAKQTLNEIESAAKETSNSFEEKTAISFAQYQSTIKDFYSNANDAIIRTQSLAQDHIRNISAESERLAMNAADNGIRNALKEENITALIKRDARELMKLYISDSLKNIVDIAKSDLQDQMKLVPDLISSSDRIRFGQRQAYDHVDSIAKMSKDGFIRKMAIDILQRKQEDYQYNADTNFAFNSFSRLSEDRLDDLFYQQKINDLVLRRDTIGIIKQVIKNLDNNNPFYSDNLESILVLYWYNKNPSIIERNLFKYIRTRNDLQLISFCFKLLQIYGYDITMFDFEKAKLIESQLK